MNRSGGKKRHVALPRIGQEDIVEFLESDLDQPIINHRTYYEKNMPLYNLQIDKTLMTIKSQPHNKNGFNKRHFEHEKMAKKSSFMPKRYK